MANVIFRRGTTAELNNIPITDGAVLFDTDTFKIYVDNNNQRLQYGGDTDIIQNIGDATEQNVFSATASVNLFLQKNSCINSAAIAKAVTQNNIPLGCKAFAEEIGNVDYSRAGNSISAVLDNITRYKEGILAAGSTSLTFSDDNFDDNTHFRPTTNKFGVNPTNMTLTGNNLTLTFEAQTEPIVVRVFYYNIT